MEDNCCQCNYVALRKMVDVAEVEVIYATFHVDVGETPFFVALDYTKKKVSRVSSLIRMHRTAFAQETSKREKKERKTIRYRAEITSKASYDVLAKKLHHDIFAATIR